MDPVRAPQPGDVFEDVDTPGVTLQLAEKTDGGWLVTVTDRTGTCPSHLSDAALDLYYELLEATP